MPPKEELEQLLNAGLPYAQDMLEEHGEFQPFGAVMDPDGEIQMVAGHSDDEVLRADAAIAILMEAFLEGAAENRYKAVALFSNVTIEMGDDGNSEEATAIQGNLEHSDGYCVDVFLPYVSAGDAPVEYRQLVASPREGQIFDP